MFKRMKRFARPLVPEKLLRVYRKLCTMPSGDASGQGGGADVIEGLPYGQAKIATKLHLGCGPNVLDGWLNSDLVTTNSAPPDTLARVKDIFIMDATSDFPFPDEQMDVIYCEDFLEHFDQLEGLGICTECYRILKSGGVWRISTPGFDTILRRMQPRSRETIEYGHWSWGHRLLYTQEYLLFLLKECGFSEIKMCSFGESSFSQLRGIDTRQEQSELNIILDAVK